MSMISTQVNELKKVSNMINDYCGSTEYLKSILLQSANTIESLYTKLSAANLKLPKRDFDGIQITEDNAIEAIQFRYGEMIGKSWDRECLGYAMDVLEAVKKYHVANMERSELCYSGEWIACKDRLPEEKTNPITKDFYEYQVTFRSEDIKDVRHYKFGNGHWWNCGQNMDEYVTAWRLPIEPYQGE